MKKKKKKMMLQSSGIKIRENVDYAVMLITWKIQDLTRPEVNMQKER